MPTLKVKIHKQKVSVKNGEEMYVAHLKSYTRMPKEEVIRVISENQGISKANVAASFYALADTFKQFLLEGHVVDLGPLGTFRASISCTAEKNLNDLSPKNITRRRIIYHPSPELMEALYDAKIVGFHEVEEEEPENT